MSCVVCCNQRPSDPGGRREPFRLYRTSDAGDAAGTPAALTGGEPATGAGQGRRPSRP
jgi:hypothetical protein